MSDHDDFASMPPPRTLSLPRRGGPLLRAQEAAAATSEARRSIDAIISQSRAPWGVAAPLDVAQTEELQKAVRSLEAALAERDVAVAEAELKLAERERELAETEALLSARERVLRAAVRPAAGAAVSGEQAEALRKLREEIERQEATLAEQRVALREREEFLEQSEARLFAKMQEQQEKETELEQREEDLKRRLRLAGLLPEEPPPVIEKA